MLLSLLFACANGVPDSDVKFIFGAWKVAEAEVFTPEDNTELEAETITLAQSVNYEFRSDFTYIIKSKVSPQGKIGHWKFDPFARNLEMSTDGETTYTSVETITEEKMTLSSLLPGLGKITMHLIKNENP